MCLLADVWRWASASLFLLTVSLSVLPTMQTNKHPPTPRSPLINLWRPAHRTSHCDEPKTPLSGVWDGRIKKRGTTDLVQAPGNFHRATIPDHFPGKKGRIPRVIQPWGNRHRTLNLVVPVYRHTAKKPTKKQTTTKKPPLK